MAWLSSEYISLPKVNYLKTEWPGTTAFMEKRKQEVGSIRYSPVPLNQISKHLRNVVLIAEDQRFFEHKGFDYEEINNAIQQNIKAGKIIRGASTITQQLSKNLYLTPSKNPMRKFKEIILTNRLENTLDKDRIFELYLNVIEWGENVYGAEEAAQYYFGVSAKDLNPAQAVLLVSIIPNPRYLDPQKNFEKLEPKIKLYLQRMYDYGRIKKDEYEKSMQLVSKEKLLKPSLIQQ